MHGEGLGAGSPGLQGAISSPGSTVCPRLCAKTTASAPTVTSHSSQEKGEGQRANSKRDGETCPAPILSPPQRPTQGRPVPAHRPGLGYVPSPGSREAGQTGTASAVESRPPALWPLGRPPVPDHVPLPLASAPNPAASLRDLSPASGREVAHPRGGDGQARDCTGALVWKCPFHSPGWTRQGAHGVPLQAREGSSERRWRPTKKQLSGGGRPRAVAQAALGAHGGLGARPAPARPAPAWRPRGSRAVHTGVLHAVRARLPVRVRWAGASLDIKEQPVSPRQALVARVSASCPQAQQGGWSARPRPGQREPDAASPPGSCGAQGKCE